MKHSVVIAALFAAAMTLSAAGLKISNTGREAMIRNESNGALELTLSSRKKTKMTGIVLKAKTPSGKETVCKVAELDPHGSAVVRFPVETNLAVGDYTLDIAYEALCGSEKLSGMIPVQYGVGPLLHDRMIVILSDHIYNLTDSRITAETGFTHAKGTKGWEFSARTNVKRSPKSGDFAIKFGFRLHEAAEMPPAMAKKYPRLGKNGKPLADTRNMDAADPRFLAEWEEFFAKPLAAMRDNPVYEGYMIFSEKVDGAEPAFAEHNKKAFKEYAGFDIPQEVENRNAPSWDRIKDFPISRVIPESYPLFVYYKWFWKEGHGWHPLFEATHRQIRKAFPRPIETYHDPAVRCPPVWGSGKGLDLIGHWTYAHPDPIRVSVNTSELQAMAAGSPGQKVMNMTQIIAYRSLTAPMGAKCANPPAWVAREPKAVYYTLAPDMMKIASWTMLTRAVYGMQYHGYNSLVDRNSGKQGYRFTNGETHKVLARFLNDVVKPLGPALKYVPERPMEVAILESFSSTVFAGRGTWGDGRWPFDAALMLHWANMMPFVLYEEQIVRDGLGSVKVLVLPHCDVLTEPVYKKIVEFQKKGGIVVADHTHVPGLMPDIDIQAYIRTNKPDQDKAAFQKQGLALRAKLTPYYTPYASASNPDLVTWVRSSGSADYFFVINDKRTFGDYIGQYGLIMEKSVSNKGTVTLNRSTGAVYDLVAHKKVPFRSENGKTSLDVDIPATEGGYIFLVLPEKLGVPAVRCPESARKGEAFDLTVTPKFASGKTVMSVHPLSIRVTDANGKSTDDTVAGAASRNGVCTHRITVPLNGAAGTWTVLVKDLASGLETQVTFSVK